MKIKAVENKPVHGQCTLSAGRLDCNLTITSLIQGLLFYFLFGRRLLFDRSMNQSFAGCLRVFLNIKKVKVFISVRSKCLGQKAYRYYSLNQFTCSGLYADHSTSQYLLCQFTDIT